MLQSPFTYFDKIYCINLDSRPDRWAKCGIEFNRERMFVERFRAISGENRFLAFNTSQHEVLKKAIRDGAKQPLILEDDVVFRSTVHLHYAMNELPGDWGVLYLGGNILGIDIIPFDKPKRYSSHLFEVKDCWQTQSVAYHGEALTWIVKNFNPGNGYNYDEWLRKEVLPRFKSFIIAPQITYQRKDRSDIWNKDVDFEHLYNEGNKILR